VKLTAAAARRFLVARHALPRTLPNVLAAFDRIGCVQVDPLAVTGMRNHDMVLAARVAGYRPSHLDRLLHETRELIEVYNKALCIVPIDTLPYYRADWDRVMGVLGDTYRAAAKKHGPRILRRLDEEGPLPSRELARDGKRVVAGWGSATEARHALYVLFRTGRIATVRREGNVRVFDRMERLVPKQRAVSAEASLRHRVLSRFRAMGLLGLSGTPEVYVATAPARERARVVRDLVEEGTLLPVTVEGMERFMLHDEQHFLDTPAPRGAAMLAPLDPLIWDRRFTKVAFGLDYKWQVYTPKHQRVGGYYDLPLLVGDRLAGLIEPRYAREKLEIVRIDATLTRSERRLVDEAIDAFTASVRDTVAERSRERLVLMGDKSPKQKDKAKKQDTADKNQKKANAADKVAKQSANTPKKK
jgi:uncharacterized protein